MRSKFTNEPAKFQFAGHPANCNRFDENGIHGYNSRDRGTKERIRGMSGFYSEELEQGISRLYFQANPELYSGGVQLLEQAAEEKEADAYYFLARDAWGDGDTAEDEAVGQSA